MESNLRSLESNTDQLTMQMGQEVAQLRSFLAKEAENGRLTLCAAEKRMQDLKDTQEKLFGHIETIRNSFRSEHDIVQSTMQEKHARLEHLNEDLVSN